MQKLSLIGDSIRMAYQPFVTDLLAGKMTVWGPEDNGGDSQNVLNNLDAWCIHRPADIIHLNCGLHDLKRPFDAPDASGNQVPLADYEANLRQIFQRIQTETEAHLIFALTTPVNQKWHHARKPFDRYEADVAAYNQVARQLCTDLNIPVNDLNARITQAGRDSLLVPDGVHFTASGSRLLAEAVVGVVG